VIRTLHGHPATIRRYPANTRPLLLNGGAVRASMLVDVKTQFTQTGRWVRREVRLGLSVRVSSGKRSLLGQIVVSLQRRLALAKPDAATAKENQCN
jgi:hypothetical protein